MASGLRDRCDFSPTNARESTRITVFVSRPFVSIRGSVRCPRTLAWSAQIAIARGLRDQCEFSTTNARESPRITVFFSAPLWAKVGNFGVPAFLQEKGQGPKPI